MVPDNPGTGDVTAPAQNMGLLSALVIGADYSQPSVITWKGWSDKVQVISAIFGSGCSDFLNHPISIRVQLHTLM